MSNKNFKFWTPFEIVKGGDGDQMRIAGVASTEDRDMDGQILKPDGFDLSSFMKGGYFNWHHGTTKDPSCIIGEPTKATIRKGSGGQELYVEGVLYKGNDKAKQVWELAQTLQKSDSKRRLGFSIEGQATGFDDSDPTIVKSAKIHNIAITHMPKNPGSVMNIIKGVSDDYDFSHLGDVEEKDPATFVKGYDVIENNIRLLMKALSTAEVKPITKESLEGANEEDEEKEKALKVVVKAFKEGTLKITYNKNKK